MNHGVSAPPGAGVSLVKCADYKCLAVRDANGRWKRFYDDTAMPGDTQAIMAIPIELILPFLPDTKRVQLCPAQLPAQR